jgi:hypothetical protein
MEKIQVQTGPILFLEDGLCVFSCPFQVGEAEEYRLSIISVAQTKGFVYKQ